MNNGGPVTAGFLFTTDGKVVAHPGMSLRDWFAAAALSGIIACHADSDERLPDEKKAAKWAFEYADAMIAAREPKPAEDIGTPPDLRDIPPS